MIQSETLQKGAIQLKKKKEDPLFSNLLFHIVI